MQAIHCSNLQRESLGGDRMIGDEVWRQCELPLVHEESRSSALCACSYDGRY